MAYHALYRKWRPMRFDDVIGQSHITNTICNEIRSGRVAHAYLFTGTRGTGKTSTAKILSRAVNCLSPIDGNPCNECELCKTIINETCLDVQEIDAASNTGVENIRDIISQVQYHPSMGKYKVFIIDEVHMLSKGAFNALLKTLEEPPAHVLFILATTEIQQIPATILSRCQRFDFRTISINDIVENIEKILSNEGISAQRDALEYVAYLGDGSMRDSLSILDQCLAFKNDGLTLADVTDIVGTVDDRILYEFAGDVARSDTVSALKRFNACVESGKNFDNIAKGLLSVFREIIMYKINKDNFSASKIKLGYLANCSDEFDVPSLIRYINILSECIASFKSFSSQRVLCECTLVRLTTPEMNTDIESALARISALENKLKSLSLKSLQNVSEPDTTGEAIDEIPLPEPPGEQSYEAFNPSLEQEMPDRADSKDTAADGGDAQKVVNNWADVTSTLASGGKLTLFTMLFGAKVKSSGDEVIIVVDDTDKVRTLKEKANYEAVREAISSTVGVDVKITVTANDEPGFSDESDIFASINEMGKQFPGNFKLD